MRIIKDRKRRVTAGRNIGKKYKYTVKASKSAKRRKMIKAETENYSMADYDIVIYRNSEKVYSGSVYDVKFYNKIRTLCKESENLRVFKGWLLDYGVSDFEDSDVPELVADMITFEWEEFTDTDEDFYVEISMYGNQYGDVRFEVFYAKDVVTASTGTTNPKFNVKASNCIAGSQWNDVDEAGYSTEDNERFEREQFAERIIHDIEDEYSIKVSSDAWGEIMDLADDLNFGKGAEKHGSTPLYYLEGAIYDIIEEDTGVVIGSSKVSKNSVTSVSAGVDSNRNSSMRYNTEKNNDMEYLTSIADGATNDFNSNYGDIGELTYDISESVITFSLDGEPVYIQPIDQIKVNWDDLNEDIEELYGTIWSEVMPRF